jgi:hypothetical protein
MSKHSSHAEIFRNSNTAISFHNAITVVHMSTSILKKEPVNFSNHHILMATTNSIYKCYELKIEDQLRL